MFLKVKARSPMANVAIIIYGREECPYCLQAQETASRACGRAVPILPEAEAPGWAVLEGRNTVPIVVVNEVPVGGADELEAIAEALGRKAGASGKNSSGKVITGGEANEMDSHDSYGQAGGAKSKSKSKSPKTSSKRKPSAYAKFVKKFASDHKGKFKGPALMKNAGAAWGKMSDSEKAKFK